MTSGKVFYRNAKTGTNHACSGAAVNSGSKRIVATAGHFGAHILRTFGDWIRYSETGRGFNSDVAFVTTFANTSGRRLLMLLEGMGSSPVEASMCLMRTSSAIRETSMGVKSWGVLGYDRYSAA